jgi:peptidoglycan hydrolase CwlO-like protein
MKDKELGALVGAGVCGLFAGLLVASGGFKGNLARMFALSGLISTPVVFVAHLLIDTKATNRVNKAESEAQTAKVAASKAESRLSELEESSARLTSELVKIREVLRACVSDRQKFSSMVANLTPAIAKLEGELAEAKDRVEELEADTQVWEEEFHSRVAVEADKRFQEAKRNEIERIFQEHDFITSEAMRLFRQLQGWGHKVASSHQQKRELITSLAQSYNQNIDELNASVDKERDRYLEQIDQLNIRVAQLQHELAGDLVEPEYGQFGYAVEGKIANDIARYIWDELQIPLSVKGYQVKPDGSVEVGYGFSRSASPEALVSDLSRQSVNLAKWLRIHKISSVRKLEIADLLVVTFRREPAVKEDTVKLLAGTAEEFIAYVTSHPIRYRLIADPGQGKTPVTAVMVSEILKVGGTRGNTGKGKKIPHTLVTVSCPDVESSQKDADYPLEIFLKYGNTTAAIKSFDDALQDWQYRKRDIAYAENFFQLWVWDELDNTLSNCSDPKETGKDFKEILKQCHHTGVGWIVSGQSLMTSQIPGFMDDDRELFTQIIIGASKIRKYLEKYGKKILSAKVVTQLLKNLDDLEPYIEDKNSMVTDAARLLRLGLILDDKSPKLYFLPNLDSAKFDAEKLETVITEASQMKRQFLVRASGKNGSSLASEAQNGYSETVGGMVSDSPFPTIGGSDHSSPSNQIPHCPHCGGSDLKVIENGKRYQCRGCIKRFVTNKVIWK